MNHPIDQNELEVARQRIHAYSACGHPVIPSAVWLLEEVARLTRYERAIVSMAAQIICPKTSPEEMVASILKERE